MRKAIGILGIIVLAAGLGVVPVEAADRQPPKGTLTLDPAHTQISFTLGGSLHTTEGSFQLKRGVITADPSNGQASGEILIDANSGATGIGMRDTTMKNDVLETERYPKITFTPEHVVGSEDQDGNFAAKLTGVLRLRGADHEITLDVKGHVNGDNLTATTHFAVPYAKWGLHNPSVLFLTVNDYVDLSIAASGKVTWATAAPAPAAPPSR